MRFLLLRSRSQVAELSQAVEALIQRVVAAPDATYTPEYFLPRIPRGAQPIVLTAYEDGQLVAVLYAYEIRTCGFRTGFAFGGDQMGRGLLVCAVDREQEMLIAGCNALIQSGIHAIRFSWTPSYDSMECRVERNLRSKIPSLRMKVVADPRTEGDWLQLKPSYEEFLAQLGPHTRRNLRYYRRKVEAAGIGYSGTLAASEFREALRWLNRLADYPLEPERRARDRRYMTTFKTPIVAGLRNAHGDFVSLVIGFTAGTHLHILTQLNSMHSYEDETLRKLSLSLVTRGYLIEDFIQRGFTAVHFIQGSSPMLGRFCAPVDLKHLSIDDGRSAFAPFKQACSRAAQFLERSGKHVPYRLRWAAGSYWK